MSALNERKVAIVRTLVESAPDRVIGSLRQALAETADNSALGGVKRLVEVEVFDRNLRNAILQPIAPMCVGGGDDPHRMTFPSRALGLIWRGVRNVEIDAIAVIRDAAEHDTPIHLVIEAQDKITATAAAGLRARETSEFRTAADFADRARPGAAEQLAACLDIAPVVRRATQRLPEWLAHPGGETSAGSRLAYKDAVTIADDAGPRFFEMLAAQMAHPWMVLRVISAVMDKPTESYLADSEMAAFGESLLADIDEALVTIGGLKPESGPAGGRAAAKMAELVVQQVMEIETCIDLQRDHGWGKRVHKQRAGLAAAVEARLKEAEKAAAEALPMHAARNQRVRRQVPRLSDPPEDRLVSHALTLLSFSDELRTTANYGGFSSARNKMVEKVGEYLDHYVDDVVDLVRTDEVEDREIAAAFLGHAAVFNHLVRGEKAGELVRRRAHTALHPEQSHRAED
ncbi:MAG: hypothetical protein KKE02_03145 [Alphaproteobacteria bacterium]|nr:hypothetical protein [Alphaproteobacteria bacterium]MBU1512803.1 hypothetical protein [Alphaproteobacteria bacterium]MBU2093979.1 hypothetical protein [Alphaproteobacteria bacterium]MBU2149993.1 hypothetical protein [Alphaproteobacteria bacterium]MBU2306466.1 hypothetical protein [Alphaproteobacteria bacterium]